MTTAQILFEQYKVLPEPVKQAYKKLILEEKSSDEQLPIGEPDEQESEDIIRISMEALHSSIEQVKLLKAGKLPTQPARAMLAEVKAELAAENAVKRKQTKKAA